MDTDFQTPSSLLENKSKGPPQFISRLPEMTQTMVIHPYLKRNERSDERGSPLVRCVEARLEEACGLANAIDLKIVFRQAVPLSKIHSATYIGEGTLNDLKTIVSGQQVTLAIFDTVLTPVQQRNLETELKCKVIDRTGLILEIFGARARTREGKLQVELAFLTHRRSRLVRAWTHLERQRGGFGFTGGPGESQMELDRRMIDTKIMKLEKDLEQVKRTRTLHRKQRCRREVPLVALVGYTNAGKSTLFNTLTQSDVFAKDLLFATLDPTIRPIKLPNGRTVLLSDTVGFISNLPTQLVAAFRATLEEVQDANVILHVRDAANPDHEIQHQDVMKVLDQLEVDYDTEFTKPALLNVFNKIDKLPDDQQNALHEQAGRGTQNVAISAMNDIGIDHLLQRIQDVLQEDGQLFHLDLPHGKGDLLSWCYRQGVIFDRLDTDEGCKLKLKLTIAQESYVRSSLTKESSSDLIPIINEKV